MTAGKRTDVGYGRPPREHQFGNRPNPVRRAKKVPVTDKPALQVMHAILSEPQRVAMNGTVKWMTNAELIFRKAMELVESGDPVLQDRITKLLLAVKKEQFAKDRAPHIIVGGVDTGPMEDWPD